MGAAYDQSRRSKGVQSDHELDFRLLGGDLGEVQSKGGFGEVQLFSQDNDRVQVTYFDVWEHCSTPRFKSRNTELSSYRLQYETTSGINIRTRRVLKSFAKSQTI